MNETINIHSLKGLLKEYQMAIKNIEHMNSIIENKKKEIIESKNKLIKTGVLDEIVNKEVGKSKQHVNIQVLLDFFRLIKSYALIEKVYNEFDNLYKLRSSEIEDNLKKLMIAENSIRWFFTRKKNKEAIINAYKDLTKFYNKSIIDEAKKSYEFIKKFEIDKELNLEKDFNNDKFKYKSILDKIDNDNTNNEIKVFKEASLRIDYLINSIKTLRQTLGKEKNEVLKDIDKFLNIESIEMLREIDIEEINRNRQGIRIKTLRENGMDDIYDIVTASIYSISNFRGISYNMAENIKRISGEILEETKSRVKVKLNYDNQSDHATKLLLALNKYIRIKLTIDKLLNESEKEEQSIKINLDNIKNNILIKDWLFHDDEKKSEIIKSYNKLIEVLSGNFEKNLNSIAYRISKVKTLDQIEVWDDFRDNAILYNNVLEELSPGILGNLSADYGLPEDLARQIREEAFFPDGLLVKLRKYQEIGVRYILHQKNVLLGDEMGLGKTIQAIATMVSLKNIGEKHFLVICPASLITNWGREIIKHSKLVPMIIHGNDRIKSFNEWKRIGGVGITTYETSKHLTFDEKDNKLGLLIVDEAHYIKNPNANRTKYVNRIGEYANRKLFMTGTALENRVEEMIILINFLQPEIVPKIDKLTFLAKAKEFRDKIAPVYYRRKVNEVLNELPEKIVKEEWCKLSPLENDIYEESVLFRRYTDSRRVSWNVENLNKSSKAKRLFEIIEEAEEDKRKVIVFSYFRETISKISNTINDRIYGPITGSVPIKKRQEIIDDFNESNAGSVLIAQIEAGGTGLNIQSASVVVLCEPQFKPSIENQAIARCHRMGQNRNVLVYRLLAENTIDEKIMDLLKNKQTQFDNYADISSAAHSEQKIYLDEQGVNSTTFGKIIEEEIERINRERNEKQFST